MRSPLTPALLALVLACSRSSSPGGSGLSGGSVASMTTTGGSTTSVLPGMTTTSSTGTDAGTSSGDDSSAASSTDTTTSDTGDLPDVGDSLPEGCKTKKIDILFVASESAPMEAHYPKLVKSLPSLVEVLEDQLSEFDHHILVANVNDAWGFPLSCPPGKDTCPKDGGCAEIKEPSYPCWAHYTSGAISQCDEKAGAGVIFTAGMEASNKRCELVDDRRYIHSGEPDLLETFTCVASQGHGIGGGGYGWAAATAVSDEFVGPGGCNEGFLRDDALLFVIMIAPGGDTSTQYNPYVWANMIIDAKDGEQDAIVALGIFGDTDMPDPVCDWEWNGKPLQLRSMLLNFEHRLFGSICEEAYAPFYKEAAELILDVCGGPIPE